METSWRAPAGDPAIGDGMIYEFGEFVLDTRRHELWRGGTPQHLEPQVYAVLCHLVENRDRLVTSRELIEHVWGPRFITPGTLNSRIKALRQALGDDGTTQCVIQTVRGRGFRIGVQVRDRSDTPRSPAPPAVEQVIRYCRAHDGVRIAYATSGDAAGPALVKPANWLTHLDQDCNSAVWRHWVSELGRGRRLIRYDERGCGLSDHDVDDLSFETWVRDLEAVVDAEGLERFSLLGISQGCAVAIAYTVRHPERVDKLVLYGGYAVGRNHRNPTPQDVLEATLLRNLIRVGWGRDNPAFRQVFGMLFLPEGTPGQWQWFSDLARTLPMENALRIMDTTHEIDVRALAELVDKPTLVLHSVYDAMIPFETGRKLAALIPRARFVPLESRNHVLLEGEPAWARFLSEVRAFLGDEQA
ncbi:MAG TPA: alpha/beta fold hydrolase [Gemmatimonadaceae bacterium]|nr:alpha/beta fold hydrolase [Gemmatimonadaceae bacterium]